MIIRLALLASILSLGILGCGKKDSKKAETNHSQPEDSMQLSDSPIFNLRADTSQDDTQFNYQKIEDHRLVLSFVKDTQYFLNTDYKGGFQLYRDKNFKVLQYWVLQNEVGFSETDNALTLKVRVKSVGLYKGLKAYQFENSYQSFRCGDELKQFVGQTATSLREKINSNEIDFCPKGPLEYKKQSLTLTKFTDGDGQPVRYFHRTGDFTKSEGFCTTVATADNTATTNCGKFIDTYYEVGEGDEMEKQGGLYFRSVAENVRYGADMNFHMSGTFAYQMNDWIGFAEFEETGNKPTLKMMNEGRGEAYKFEF